MGSFIFSVLGILVLIAFSVMLGTTVVKAIRNTRFRVPLLSTIVLFFLILGCAVAVVSTEPVQDSNSKLKFNGHVAEAQVNEYEQNKMNHSKEIDFDKYNHETYDHNQLLKITNAKVNKISNSEAGNKVVEVTKGNGKDKASYFIIDYDHKNLKEGQTYTFYGKEDLKYDANSQLHGLNVWKVE
ncbi:NADH-quinone oxidoreductase subunit J [Mammaliicoccus vitulinus]|uniref:NADH-quinone oxidoreductase subunit J n=1 Tax=Mammaliicoccus vitulinus TaxID=71237 RepID=UPI003BA01AC8